MPTPPGLPKTEAEQSSESVTATTTANSPALRLIESLLALLGVVAAFVFILMLWYRWLRPDPGLLAFSASIAQLLALVSLLGLQTQWGKDTVSGMKLGRRQNKRRALAILWVLVAFLAIFFFIGSPLATDYYNQSGVDALEAGQYGVAVRNFRQAVSLTPENSHAHFNLGNSYELLSQFDQAMAEYQIALEQDDQLGAAYNNLGRLYLLARHDPDSALSILQVGLGRVTDPFSKSILKKNIGKAYVDKGLHRTALAVLNEAADELQALSNQGVSVAIYLAETYRLMALAYQARGESEQADRAWSSSLGYALAVQDSGACARPSGQSMIDCPNSRLWAAEAHEHLDTTER